MKKTENTPNPGSVKDTVREENSSSAVSADNNEIKPLPTESNQTEQVKTEEFHAELVPPLAGDQDEPEEVLTARHEEEPTAGHQEELTAKHEEEFMAGHEEEPRVEQVEELIAAPEKDLKPEPEEELIAGYEEKFTAEHAEEITAGHEEELKVEHIEELAAEHVEELTTEQVEELKAQREEELTAGHEIHETVVNYDQLSRAELVDILEKVVKEDNINAIKTTIALIKVAFLKKKKEENLTKYEAALAEGSSKNELPAEQDELDVKFTDIFNIYKANKARYVEEQEKQKHENLRKKLHIIEDLEVILSVRKKP